MWTGNCCLARCAERTACYIFGYIVERRVHLLVESVAGRIHVAKCIVARAIAGIARGGFQEETTCYLPLLYSRAQNKWTGEQHPIIRVVKHGGEECSRFVEGGEIDYNRVVERIDHGRNKVVGGQDGAGGCLEEILN